MSEAAHTVNVFPVDDYIEHEYEDDGSECVCGPDVEVLNGSKVILHHSLDGREQKRPGLGKPTGQATFTAYVDGRQVEQKVIVFEDRKVLRNLSFEVPVEVGTRERLVLKVNTDFDPPVRPSKEAESA